MTATAVLAEGAPVDVIPSMALGTLGRERDLVGHAFGVAGNALQARVGTIQVEIRLPVVIKGPQLPVVRGVTGGASGSKAALVRVILGMAVVAAGSGALIVRRDVARLAGHHRVQAVQWEARQVVVEGHFLRPADCSVASCAFIAKLAGMDVIPLVAGDAGCLGLDRVHGTRVATPATHILVRA